MGLDIIVRVKVSEVRDCVGELESTLQEREAMRILDTMPMDRNVSTRPGSYSGLHAVRCEYAKLKGWATSGTFVAISDESKASHLINHSDCDGYYMPDEFIEPQWLATSQGHNISLGSSVRLLDELTELMAVKDRWPDGFQRRWDAVFIAAVASVVSGQPIIFC